VIAPVNKDFANLPVLLNFDDNVRASRRVVKDMIYFLKMILDVCAKRGRNVHVTPRIFKLHRLPSSERKVLSAEY
jgi:hypothetical protein